MKSVRRRVAPPMVVLAAIVLALAACTSTPRAAPSASDSLAWAGFGATTGLQLVAVDESSFLDTEVRFALRGSKADVDRALEAAHFSTSTAPGVQTFQEPLPGIDLATLTSPEHADDHWKTPTGSPMTRKIVRGTDPTHPDQILLHVWAFTT